MPFPPPVDHILSELSAMTCPSWVALHSMACSFTELHKPFTMIRQWFLYICTTSFFIHSSCQRTLGLSPCLVYCEQCYCEQRDACIFRITDLPLYIPRSGITGSCGNTVFRFLRNVIAKPGCVFTSNMFVCIAVCLLFYHTNLLYLS